MPTQLLTAAEVAAFVQVSVDTLANWRYLGRGPAYVRQGRIVRYPTDALDAWIATNQVAPTHA